MKLTVYNLNKLKTICEDVGTDYFTLTQTADCGIGSTLTMTYHTEVAGYEAEVSIVVSGVEDW
jgi:hypothetical protein